MHQPVAGPLIDYLLFTNSIMTLGWHWVGRPSNTVLFTYLFTSELIPANPMPQIGRPKVAKTLPSRYRAMQQKLSNALGEHLVNYRNSALVSEHWSNAKGTPWTNGDDNGPQAGEVFRDAYLETRSGPVALRHLYRGLGHHLMLFAADESNLTTSPAGSAKPRKSWPATDRSTSSPDAIYHP